MTRRPAILWSDMCTFYIQFFTHSGLLVQSKATPANTRSLVYKQLSISNPSQNPENFKQHTYRRLPQTWDDVRDLSFIFSRVL